MKVNKTQPTFDDQELEILHALEAGKLKSVANVKRQIKTHRAAAEATLKKDQHHNSRDLRRELNNQQA